MPADTVSAAEFNGTLIHLRHQGSLFRLATAGDSADEVEPVGARVHVVKPEVLVARLAPSSPSGLS